MICHFLSLERKKVTPACPQIISICQSGRKESSSTDDNCSVEYFIFSEVFANLLCRFQHIRAHALIKLLCYCDFSFRALMIIRRTELSFRCHSCFSALELLNRLHVILVSPEEGESHSKSFPFVTNLFFLPLSLRFQKMICHFLSLERKKVTKESSSTDDNCSVNI